MPIDEAIREALEKLEAGNEHCLKPVSEAVSAGKLDAERARSALRDYLRSVMPDFRRMLEGGKDEYHWKNKLREAEDVLEALKEKKDVTYKGFAFNLPHKQNS